MRFEPSRTAMTCKQESCAMNVIEQDGAVLKRPKQRGSQPKSGRSLHPLPARADISSVLDEVCLRLPQTPSVHSINRAGGSFLAELCKSYRNIRTHLENLNEF